MDTQSTVFSFMNERRHERPLAARSKNGMTSKVTRTSQKSKSCVRMQQTTNSETQTQCHHTSRSVRAEQFLPVTEEEQQPGRRGRVRCRKRIADKFFFFLLYFLFPGLLEDFHCPLNSCHHMSFIHTHALRKKQQQINVNKSVSCLSFPPP
jgi:hypothetical protein